MKIKSVFIQSLLPMCFFALGWFGNSVLQRGENAMAAFMTSYSALAYLQKGDIVNAMLVLRASTEANILEADRYGDWYLWAHSPDAMSRWFSGYERLRSNLPESSRGPVDEEFDRRLDDVLKSANASAKVAK